MLICQISYGFASDESIDAASRSTVFKYFGTYSKAMVTMFEITHVSYAPVARAMEAEMGEVYSWVFIIYRCTISFAFVGVIRAVFVSQTLQTAHNDPDLRALAKAKAHRAHDDRLKLAWQSLREYGSDDMLTKEQ